MDYHETPAVRRSAQFWRATLIFGLGLLIAVTSFGAGMLAERDLVNGGGFGRGSGDNSDDFDQLNEVRKIVESQYYAVPAEPTAAAKFEEQLEYGAIQGMMGQLDDYSSFLVPTEQSAVRDHLSGEYQGIGVWVDFPDGKLTIISPMPNSPAEESGLQAGDVIEAADGHSLANTTADDALDLVRGPEGTAVRLTVRRAGIPEAFDVNVERRRIPVLSVNYRAMPEQHLAYIQVTVFGDKTTAELDAAIKQAEADGAQGIILDLRNNGGGWVTSAQEMIGRFVPADQGPALYENLNPDGSESTPLEIIAGDTSNFEIPIVALVNGGTASASEIVAGALRDYGRATIVGEKTFGKGSVQRVYDFEDGSSARVTFAEWLTPDQHRIQGEGIVPDVVVSLDPAVSGDTQIDRAAELLTGLPAVATGPPAASPVASPVATPVA
jgi:carboxyl-terminal processing protease